MTDYAVDGGRDRPRPRLRRPHRDRHRQRPPGRLDADADRPPAGRSPSSPAGSTGSRTSTASPRRSSAEARPLIDHDTIRVYRVDHDDGHVRADRVPGHVPRRDRPRSGDAAGRRSATGLTGWVAAHGEIGPARRRARATRARWSSRSTDGPESMLLVPMTFDGTVHGVIVVSKDGRDRFDADDETTLTIFAGYAAQALVNGTNMRAAAAPAGGARAPARRASAACSRSTSACCRRSSRPASSTSSPTRSRRSSRTTR